MTVIICRKVDINTKKEPRNARPYDQEESLDCSLTKIFNLMKIGGTIETYTFLIQKITTNTTKKVSSQSDKTFYILY